MLSHKHRRWLALLGAVLILLGTAYLARAWRRTFPTVSILQAAADIAPGERINADALTVGQVPAGALPPHALRSPEEAAGRWATTAIHAGEVISSRKVSETPPDPHRAALQPGAGLLSLPVTPSHTLGGVLRPGDVVNVYTLQVAEPDRTASIPILAAEGIEIVDVRNGAGAPTYGEPGKPAAMPALEAPTGRTPAWVVVRVTPDVAVRLIAAVESRAAVYFYLTGRGSGI